MNEQDFTTETLFFFIAVIQNLNVKMLIFSDRVDDITDKASYSLCLFIHLFIYLTVKYCLLLFTFKDENPWGEKQRGSAKGNGCS